MEVLSKRLFIHIIRVAQNQGELHGKQCSKVLSDGTTQKKFYLEKWMRNSRNSPNPLHWTPKIFVSFLTHFEEQLLQRRRLYRCVCIERRLFWKIWALLASNQFKYCKMVPYSDSSSKLHNFSQDWSQSQDARINNWDICRK